MPPACICLPPTNITTSSNAATRTDNSINRTTTIPSIEPSQPNQSQPSSLSHPTVYRSMPFIPKLSTIIANSLKKHYPQVKIAFRTVKSTKTILPKMKDTVDPMKQSNVIYSIPCGDCQMSYIGMTRNQLSTRLCGHRSNIHQYEALQQNTNTDISPALEALSEKTALIQHSIQQNHTFNLSLTKIIDRSYRTSALPMLEMCHIANTSNTVNHRTDVDGLNATYAGILYSIKTLPIRRKAPTVDQTNTSQTHSFSPG